MIKLKTKVLRGLHAGFYLCGLLLAIHTMASDKTEVSSAGQALAKILTNTQSFQAEFKQKVYQENQSKADVSSGHLMIKRPQQFKWQTIEPYEQVITADGENLWTYDPELEQVMVQNQKSLLADSPILLLTSSIDSLTNNFKVETVDSSDLKPNQTLYALTAHKNRLFESIHILTEGNNIKELFLVDSLGGRTIVEFSQIQLNATIDPNAFIFVPPPGVDLIDSRAVTEDRVETTERAEASEN